jgi:hypothetical protein
MAVLDKLPSPSLFSGYRGMDRKTRRAISIFQDLFYLIKNSFAFFKTAIAPDLENFVL